MWYNEYGRVLLELSISSSNALFREDRKPLQNIHLQYARPFNTFFKENSTDTTHWILFENYAYGI